MSEPIKSRPRKYARLYVGIYNDMRKLFGPPPVLSSENRVSFNRILLALIEDLQPQDFVERLIVRQIADSKWEISRYTRLETSNIERSLQEVKQERMQCLKAKAKWYIKQAIYLGRTGKGDASLAEARRLLKEAGAILQQPPSEDDHVEALRRGMKRAESFASLRNAAVARCDALLDRVARYRASGLNRSILPHPAVFDVEAPGKTFEAQAWCFEEFLAELTGQPPPEPGVKEDDGTSATSPAHTAPCAHESEPSSIESSSIPLDAGVPSIRSDAMSVSIASDLPESAPCTDTSQAQTSAAPGTQSSAGVEGTKPSHDQSHAL